MEGWKDGRTSQNSPRVLHLRLNDVQKVMRGYNTVTHKGEMGAYPSKHTHGCIRLRLTNWQTNRQSFSKSREWVFLHLFMFIGIRSIGRRLRHYLYKLVHYTQLDSNITYTVFIKNMVSKSQASSHRLFRFVSKRTPELALAPLTLLTEAMRIQWEEQPKSLATPPAA